MFPLGNAAGKRARRREDSLRRRQPGVCQLWHALWREPLLWQGVEAGGSGGFAVMDPGRTQRGMEAVPGFIALECERLILRWV